MPHRIIRALGTIVLAGPERDELTPAQARSIAHRLVDAARDVERQVPVKGDGWAQPELS
ncbi:hypothetical protein [Kitasatospora sp. NPDC101183]|uniref:hypothetical protein n=1 Tax=Kitasatospora sp. NPDC101183 TaxID=3364100 RepID=UPI0037F11A63